MYLMIKELSPSADEVAKCWLLLCSNVHFVCSESDFICLSLGVGYYSDKFSDEGYE